MNWEEGHRWVVEVTLPSAQEFEFKVTSACMHAEGHMHAVCMLHRVLQVHGVAHARMHAQRSKRCWLSMSRPT